MSLPPRRKVATMIKYRIMFQQQAVSLDVRSRFIKTYSIDIQLTPRYARTHSKTGLHRVQIRSDKSSITCVPQWVFRTKLKPDRTSQRSPQPIKTSTRYWDNLNMCGAVQSPSRAVAMMDFSKAITMRSDQLYRSIITMIEVIKKKLLCNEKKKWPSLLIYYPPL
jgi:hypothetical protein